MSKGNEIFKRREVVKERKKEDGRKKTTTEVEGRGEETREKWIEQILRILLGYAQHSIWPSWLLSVDHLCDVK